MASAFQRNAFQANAFQTIVFLGQSFLITGKVQMQNDLQGKLEDKDIIECKVTDNNAIYGRLS